MQKTKIEWCNYTWNPIVGCKRGCSYCYAKRIWDRFNPGMAFSEIRVYPDRLADKMPKEPSKIFVGSMSDFEYWDRADMESVLRVCESNPQHTFIFLSKSLPYWLIPWPENTMQGLTTENPNLDKGKVLRMGDGADCPRPFLSIEPMFGGMDYACPDYFECVIAGAQTGPGANGPADWMIKTILQNVPEEKLFWKDTLKARAAKLKAATSTTPNKRQGKTAEHLNSMDAAASPVLGIAK